jgi:hypothetical protein
MTLLPEILARVDRAFIFDNTVCADDRASFQGRLVARLPAAFDCGGAIMVRPPLPSWLMQYLIAPANARHWQLSPEGLA